MSSYFMQLFPALSIYPIGKMTNEPLVKPLKGIQIIALQAAATAI